MRLTAGIPCQAHWKWNKREGKTGCGHILKKISPAREKPINWKTNCPDDCVLFFLWLKSVTLQAYWIYLADLKSPAALWLDVPLPWCGSTQQNLTRCSKMFSLAQRLEILSFCSPVFANEDTFPIAALNKQIQGTFNTAQSCATAANFIHNCEQLSPTWSHRHWRTAVSQVQTMPTMRFYWLEGE